MLSLSIYMMQIYDRVLVSRNETTLSMLTFVVVGLYVLMTALEAVRTFVMVRIGARLDDRMKTRVFNAAFERNLARPGSNVTQMLGDLTSVRQALTGAGLIALFDIPWMPVYLVVIFMFSWKIGIMVLVGMLVLATLAVLNERVSRPLLEESSKVPPRRTTWPRTTCATRR